MLINTPKVYLCMTDKKIIDFDKIQKYIPEERVRTEWEGEQIMVDELVNTKFAVLDFEVFPSTFQEDGEFVSVQAMDQKNKKFWFNTGSGVVRKQLQKEITKEKLPMVFVLKKIKRYYKLDNPTGE